MRDMRLPRQCQPSSMKRSAVSRVFFDAVHAITPGLVTNIDAPAEWEIFDVSRSACGQSSGTKPHS